MTDVPLCSCIRLTDHVLNAYSLVAKGREPVTCSLHSLLHHIIFLFQAGQINILSLARDAVYSTCIHVAFISAQLYAVYIVPDADFFQQLAAEQKYIW